MNWNETQYNFPKESGEYLVAIKNSTHNDFYYRIYKYDAKTYIWRDMTGHSCYKPEYWTKDIESPE